MLKRNARTLRKHMTDAERALWKHLRLRQIEGQKFRRQYPIGPYIVDFVCLEKRFIIEVDGGHHASQMDEDAKRTAWLHAQGFRVLRLWNHDVLTETEAVMDQINEALIWLPPPTSILPREGGRKGDLVRLQMLEQDLDAAYWKMAHDKLRETEALEWSESIIDDVSDQPNTHIDSQ